MAKKKVKFDVTDGKAPRKIDTPGKPFGLRAPMDINVPVGVNRSLSLGLTCQLPVVVVDSAGASLYPPNTQLRANLTNVNVSEGEVIAQAFVLDNSDVEVE